MNNNAGGMIMTNSNMSSMAGMAGGGLVVSSTVNKPLSNASNMMAPGQPHHPGGHPVPPQVCIFFIWVLKKWLKWFFSYIFFFNSRRCKTVRWLIGWPLCSSTRIPELRDPTVYTRWRPGCYLLILCKWAGLWPKECPEILLTHIQIQTRAHKVSIY